MLMLIFKVALTVIITLQFICTSWRVAESFDVRTRVFDLVRGVYAELFFIALILLVMA